MNRAEFERTIRTAGSVLNETEVLVIGSQAIHASTLNVPEIAERSMEGDFATFNDPPERKADLLVRNALDNDPSPKPVASSRVRSLKEDSGLTWGSVEAVVRRELTLCASMGQRRPHERSRWGKTQRFGRNPSRS